MDKRIQVTRRSFMAGVSMTALMPATGLAQTGIPFENFAARARAISGFDVVPRNLMVGARTQLDTMQQRAFVAGRTAARDVDKTVLKALYTGMHRPEGQPPERFAYAQALMYAAIEDTVNVPSYCGGVPGYWAEKPESA
ncbi:sugar dehydrogenase complex small subunit [Marivita sp. S0852]|uniref:sugar dehydrogenase complex small subunit n=1 Tax=Marivita sp. S0852 TaxID=3373893 RepID=UPI003982307C